VQEASNRELIRARRSRYREERTLVRAVFPVRGQDRDIFKDNVRRLRRHLQQFNADVSGLCQWLIRLRPGSKDSVAETQRFWEFFLEPERFLTYDDPAGPDSRRLDAFDAALTPEGHETLPDPPFSPELKDSIRAVAAFPRTQSAQQLFARLQDYQRPHRKILLKAAAEWVFARYVRGYENWLEQRTAWDNEKAEWESKRPELTPEIREQFNAIFRELNVREKRPRICSWERLQQKKDNCEYAGQGSPREKRHSPLCVKYAAFLRRERQVKAKNWKKYFRDFRDNAELYLKSGIRSLHPEAQNYFQAVWGAYLREMGLNEATVREQYGGRLPHCDKLGGDCEFNQHTELCKQYEQRLRALPEEIRRAEPVYREWRRHYLSGPSKPNFRYPSARLRSVPKIFGKDYFQADFENSTVGLRLDDMGEGEFLRFAFKPWPRQYSPQPGETEITSVHLHFVGTRPRIGFRFLVPHKPSRFQCSQDELDFLRSRRYPRVAQDQQFLDAARELLLRSFHGDPQKELKILAVDLGERGAHAAIYQGGEFRSAMPLKIIKIDKLYDAPPESSPAQSAAQARAGATTKRRVGLAKKHVGRHLQTLSEEAAKIAKKRVPAGPGRLGEHDLRGLTRHVGWMLRDWARLNASQIIKLAETESADLVVFESLRGFKPPGYDKLDDEKKRRLAFFAFGRIRRKLTEKAVERGMRVVTVPEFKSSQVCSRCGRLQEDKNALRRNKKKRRFRCEHKSCGYEGNSDENAARVLGRVFWGEIQIPASERSPFREGQK
jgi:IS605 OrfB family transposase